MKILSAINFFIYIEIQKNNYLTSLLCFCRESIYRLLPQTTPENIAKNFDQYTIDPTTRYPNLNSSSVRPHQVRAATQHPLFFFFLNSVQLFIAHLRNSDDVIPMLLTSRCVTSTCERA